MIYCKHARGLLFQPSRGDRCRCHDEPRYAGSARHGGERTMVTPRLYGKRGSKKPVLYEGWAAGQAQTLRSVSEAAARMPSALCASVRKRCRSSGSPGGVLWRRNGANGLLRCCDKRRHESASHTTLRRKCHQRKPPLRWSAPLSSSAVCVIKTTPVLHTRLLARADLIRYFI